MYFSDNYSWTRRPPGRPPSDVYFPPIVQGPLSIRDFTAGCLNKFITLFPAKSERPVWYYPTYVDSNGVYGYIWAEFIWVPLTLTPEILRKALVGMNGGENCIGPRQPEY